MKYVMVMVLFGIIVNSAEAEADVTANISYVPNKYNSVLFEVDVENDSSGDIWVPKDQFCKLYADNFIVMSDAAVYFEKEYPPIESPESAGESDEIILRNVKVSKGTRFTCYDDDLGIKYSLSSNNIKYYYFQFFIKNILSHNGEKVCELRSNVIKLDIERDAVVFDFSFEELAETEFKLESFECN